MSRVHSKNLLGRNLFISFIWTLYLVFVFSLFFFLSFCFATIIWVFLLVIVISFVFEFQCFLVVPDIILHTHTTYIPNGHFQKHMQIHKILHKFGRNMITLSNYQTFPVSRWRFFLHISTHLSTLLQREVMNLISSRRTYTLQIFRITNSRFHLKQHYSFFSHFYLFLYLLNLYR